MLLYRFGGTGEVLVTDNTVITEITNSSNWTGDPAEYHGDTSGLSAGSTYYDYDNSLKYEWTGTELIRIKFNTEV